MTIKSGFTNLMVRICGTLVCFVLQTISAQAQNYKYPPGNSCIECHSNLDIIRLTTPVELWKGSVHAKVGNTCDGCHNGDPSDQTMNAMSPQKNFLKGPKANEVPGFCGKCHQNVMENYNKSPHAMILQPTCVDCHGSHQIHSDSQDIIRPDKCEGCHDFSGPEKLKNLIQHSRTTFRDFETRLDAIHGFPKEPLQKNLRTIRDSLRGATATLHAFDIKETEKVFGRIQDSFTDFREELEGLEKTSRTRNLLGIGIILLLGLMAVLTYLYNRQNRGEEIG